MFIRLSSVTLIFALAALGTPVVKRDVEQVTHDLQSLYGDTNMLGAYVRKLSTNDPSDINNIMATVAKLDNGLHTAEYDTNASDSEGFTASQANDILEILATKLEPSVEGALADLVSKKRTIDAIGMTSTTKGSLDVLRTDTAELGEALSLKVPKAKQEELEAMFNVIANRFSDAINAYD